MEPRQTYPARKSLLGPLLVFAVIMVLFSVCADSLYLDIFVQPWIADVLLVSTAAFVLAAVAWLAIAFRARKRRWTLPVWFTLAGVSGIVGIQGGCCWLALLQPRPHTGFLGMGVLYTSISSLPAIGLFILLLVLPPQVERKQDRTER
jgi:hypothetical protein